MRIGFGIESGLAHALPKVGDCEVEPCCRLCGRFENCVFYFSVWKETTAEDKLLTVVDFDVLLVAFSALWWPGATCLA